MRPTASSSTTSGAEARRLGRYFLVGAAAATVDVGLFMLGAAALGLPYLAVAAASFVAGTLVNYFLSVRFVFASGLRFGRRRELALVFAVSAAGLALNQALLAACVELAGAALLPAKLAATASVFAWNYLARRNFVFAARK